MFTDSEKLRILADLFDAADRNDIETVLAKLDWSKHNDGQVQRDLRRIADQLEGHGGVTGYVWGNP